MRNYLTPVAFLVALLVAFQALIPTPPVQAERPLIEQVVQADTMPGFFPVAPVVDPAPAANTCTCGDFAALEKRVSELEKKVATYGTARPAATNGSAGVTTKATTNGLPYGSVIVSERVVSSTPVVQSQPVYQMQRQPVRTVVRGAATATCRIVNGVRVCN